jgi:hypothetical protein
VIINIFMSMDMAMDMDRYRGSDKFRSNFAGYLAPLNNFCGVSDPS